MFDQDRLRRIPDHIAATSLKEVIEQRAVLHPERTAINFLHDGELDLQESLSYAELDMSARAILRELRNCSRKGERVVLLFPAGNLFLQSFVACLYGGIVAVPVAFPGRRELDWERVFGIVNDCGATAILSFGEHLKKVESHFSRNFSQWRGAFIDVAAVPLLNGFRVTTTDIHGDDLAFLQYTSGSTGAPKGVMVSHANLLHNQRVLQTGFKNDGDTRYVSWLPLFHDMGLIGCALQSFYLGVGFNYMAPAAFLQRPLRWINAISHFRATTSGAPNFAYALCAARYNSQECQHIDLSSWQCAFNGAEPVRPGTLTHFQETYARHGLAQTAQFPCYGLAEGVLMVSGATAFAPAKLLRIQHTDYLNGVITPAADTAAEDETSTLVGVGPAVGNQELIIVNPQTGIRTTAGAIGEVWLSGPSVACGYWQKPNETRETFQARPDGATDGKTYLRTGDSGYLDQDGELYITGRIKDTIIINGKNYFPQDLELVVETADESLKPGGGAIFSIEHDGQERIVVLQEVHRTHQKELDATAVIKTIRQRVASEFELNVFDVCLLKPTTLLKTTSGKVQRQQNKKAYLANALSLLGRHRPEQPQITQAVIHSGDQIFQIVQQWLKAQPAATGDISASDLFIDAGLTSVDAVALAEHLSTQFGQRVEATLVWEFPEIGGFCQALAALLSADGNAQSAATVSAATSADGAKVDVYAMDDQAFQSLLEKEIS